MESDSHESERTIAIRTAAEALTMQPDQWALKAGKPEDIAALVLDAAFDYGCFVWNEGTVP
jgi:hypothetical protein